MAVLLQCFLTELCPEIGCPLLLRIRPATFSDALKDAEEIEYVQAFNSLGEEIHATEQQRDSQSVWIALPFASELSFKLLRASTEGGRQPVQPLLTHYPY